MIFNIVAFFFICFVALIGLFSILAIWANIDNRIDRMMDAFFDGVYHLWKASPYDRFINKMVKKVETWSNKLKDKRKTK